MEPTFNVDSRLQINSLSADYVEFSVHNAVRYITT